MTDDEFAFPKPQGSVSLRLISIKETDRRTGTTHKQRIRLESAGKFPRRVPIADRTTGYVEQEVQQWIDENVQKREQALRNRRSPNPLARDNRRQTSFSNQK